MGESVEENSQDLEFTELQILRLVQLPGLAARPGHSLGKADMEFNSQPQRTGIGFQLSGSRHAIPACYSSATRLQRLLHSINHTPPLAVQLNGRVSSFLRLFYPSFYDWQSN